MLESLAKDFEAILIITASITGTGLLIFLIVLLGILGITMWREFNDLR